MAARGRTPDRRVQHYLLYVVLAALAAYCAVERRGEVGKAEVPDLFSGKIAASASVSMTFEYRPSWPGNGRQRAARGSAGHQPVPSAPWQPQRRKGSTEEAAPNSVQGPDKLAA